MPEHDIPMRPSVVALATRKLASTSIRARASVVATGLLLFVGLAPPGPAQARDAEVRIADFEFTPARVTVGIGDRVEWVMGPDPEQHTVTPDRQGSFPGSPVLQPGDPGDRHSVTFRRAGRFRYHCDLHPNMTGLVTVVAAPGGSLPPSTPPQGPPSAAPSVGPIPTATHMPTAPPTPSADASPTPAVVQPSASPSPPSSPAPAVGVDPGASALVAAAVILAGTVLFAIARRRRS